mgnify:CR=1 FL=1
MLVEKMRDLCSNNCTFLSEPLFQTGFIVGAALILLIVLLVWLIISRRTKLDAIHVKEEGGAFVLSTAALKTFLKRIVLEFSKSELKDVRIRKKGDGFMLTLLLQVYPDTDVITLRSRLRERILADAEKKLGVAEQIQGIDIKISKMRDDGAVPVIPIDEQPVKTETAPESALPPLK